MKKVFIILAVIIVIGGSVTAAFCPLQYVENNFPTIGEPRSDNGYYIMYFGVRKELSDIHPFFRRACPIKKISVW